MEEKLHPEKSGPFFRVPGKKSHLEKSSPFPPESREEDAWLSERQLAKCSPAEVDQFGSPVPTRMVSNGEYMPIAQTEKQKRVEARILELADSASKRLGMSRRMFLATTGGFAAAFLATNEVFGHFFNVSLLGLNQGITRDSAPLLENPCPSSGAIANPCTPGVSAISPTTLSCARSTITILLACVT